MYDTTYMGILLDQNTSVLLLVVEWVNSKGMVTNKNLVSLEVW